MPTASGNIHTTSGTKFIASFTINGIDFTFSGSIDPSVQQFSSSKATVSFGSVNDLTSTRSWSGQVGPSTVVIVTSNNVRISAPVSPLINPASTVSGSGTWTEN